MAEAWILDSDMKRCTDTFDNKHCCRIMENCWNGCQIGNYSVRLNWGLLPALSVNASSVCMDMWDASVKSTLLARSFVRQPGVDEAKRTPILWLEQDV